jgi:hypothetical protein
VEHHQAYTNHTVTNHRYHQSLKYITVSVILDTGIATIPIR